MSGSQLGGRRGRFRCCSLWMFPIGRIGGWRKRLQLIGVFWKVVFWYLHNHRQRDFGIMWFWMVRLVIYRSQKSQLAQTYMDKNARKKFLCFWYATMNPKCSPHHTRMSNHYPNNPRPAVETFAHKTQKSISHTKPKRYPRQPEHSMNHTDLGVELFQYSYSNRLKLLVWQGLLLWLLLWLWLWLWLLMLLWLWLWW